MESVSIPTTLVCSKKLRLQSYLDILNQGNLEVSFEPVRSLRRRNLFDLYFWELQDMSNYCNPQASRMVPLMLILKKYAVVLYYNTQASVPTIKLV